MSALLLAVTLCVGAQERVSFGATAECSEWGATVAEASPPDPRQRETGRTGNGLESGSKEPDGVVPSRPVGASLPILIYGGAALADYASTRYALAAGAREANPIVRSNLVGWKAFQVAALTGVDVALQRKGHRGKARALRITAAVVGASLTAWNVRTARRQR